MFKLLMLRSSERGAYGGVELLFLLGMGALIAATVVRTLLPALQSLHGRAVGGISSLQETGF
ncbi:MAG: hypothetical protein ACPLSY_04835 [Moorellaceae bacterium]